MYELNKLQFIIEKLNRFIIGEDISLSFAKVIEGDLAELFDDSDEVIDNFLHDIAFYRPGGGAHLFDFDTILPKAKYALKHIQKLHILENT